MVDFEAEAFAGKEQLVKMQYRKGN